MIEHARCDGDLRAPIGRPNDSTCGADGDRPVSVSIAISIARDVSIAISIARDVSIPIAIARDVSISISIAAGTKESFTRRISISIPRDVTVSISIARDVSVSIPRDVTVSISIARDVSVSISLTRRASASAAVRRRLVVRLIVVDALARLAHLASAALVVGPAAAGGDRTGRGLTP